MAISAAPAFDSAPLAPDFQASMSMQAASPVLFKALQSNTPGQIQRLDKQVKGADAQSHSAISQALHTHKQGARRIGLAGLERGKCSNVFNPVKDSLVLGTAAVLPAFAPVASALTLASVMSYVNADRKSLGKQKNLQALLDDEIRQATYKPQNFMDVNWGQTGYHAHKPANDAPSMSREEFAFYARPPEQSRHVQILMGQQAIIDKTRAANANRALKGVALSRESLESAQDMDLKRLHDPKITEINLPGREI